MNRIRLQLLALLLLVCLEVFPQVSGTSYKEALNTKKATLSCVYFDLEGFIENKNGKEKGLLAVLMEDFAVYVKKKKGIEITYDYIQLGDFKYLELLSKVKDGKNGVFGLSTISIREDRKIDYNFSPTYMVNVLVLINHNTMRTLKSVYEMPYLFANATAYTMKKTSYSTRLYDIKKDVFPNMKLEYVESLSEIQEALKTNERSMAVVDYNVYQDMIKKGYPIERQPKLDYLDDELGIIMPKSSDWGPILNEFFNSGYISGYKYEYMVRKNLGENVLAIWKDFLKTE